MPVPLLDVGGGFIKGSKMISDLTDEQIEKFEKEIQSYLIYTKEKIKKVADECIDDVYINVIPHAYGDALTNFRNEMMDELVKEKPSEHGYQQEKLRQQIWKLHKNEIVELLNADLLKENNRLQELYKDYIRTDYWRKFK
jgi:ABC-type transporter MlaC component